MGPLVAAGNLRGRFEYAVFYFDHVETTRVPK